MPILTDIDFILDELDPKLFPGLPKGIKVHNGFGKAHAESVHISFILTLMNANLTASYRLIRTSSDVLAAVKSALSQSGLNQVTVVGHSLGGAIALLNGVFLPLNLPDISVKTVTYGMPRVGNKAFAKYVDANVSIDRVVNQSVAHFSRSMISILRVTLTLRLPREDIVPILPGRFLGFRHPGGEKHIQDDLSWVSCPGGDNTDKRCSVGDARNIFDASVKDHSGKSLPPIIIFQADWRLVQVRMIPLRWVVNTPVLRIIMGSAWTFRALLVSLMLTSWTGTHIPSPSRLRSRSHS